MNIKRARARKKKEKHKGTYTQSLSHIARTSTQAHTPTYVHTHVRTQAHTHTHTQAHTHIARKKKVIAHTIARVSAKKMLIITHTFIARASAQKKKGTHI